MDDYEGLADTVPGTKKRTSSLSRLEESDTCQCLSMLEWR